MEMSANNHDGPQERQGNSMNQQQVVSREVTQQASQLHAAQLSQLTQQQQRIGGAPVAAYPTVAPLPNGGAYSIIQPHGAVNMGLPPGAQIIMAYPHPNVAYHLTPALLNAHTSLFRPPPCSIPSMIQPTTTTQQQSTIHQYQHIAPMGMVPKVAHSTPDIVPRPPLEARKEHRPQRQKLYRDFANDPESNRPPKRERARSDQTFPMLLYRILSNSECKDYITWLPHGRAFKIHKPKDVEENVLPLYFRHAKLASFMRQVNGWGFKRMPTGPDRHAYYHEMFLRGFPYLCAKMRRPIHKSASSSQEPTIHPNFYDSKKLVALPNITQHVATRESTSPTNISSDSAYRDTDGSGSGPDQGAVMFGGRNHGNNDRGALYPEQEMYAMSTLYNSCGGSDQDSSRLGGNLYGSVAGSDENGFNPFATGSLEQGFGSENGSSGDVECSNNLSPLIHIGGNISDGTGIASFDPSAAYAPRTNRSSGSDISGEGRTTSDGSSSGARKSSEPSQSTSSSNGNSSDGSGSGSIIHLLTDTALRAAAALSGGHAPAFVMAAGCNGVDNARDTISSVGSDTGNEPVSDVSSVSRCWAAFGRRSSSKRTNRKMTSDARIRCGERDSSKRARRQMTSAALLVARKNVTQGESSDGSSSDDDHHHGRR